MHALAVVPIFMSAGAAVLPTIVAAVASVAAVALRPRALLRLVTRRPFATATSIAVVALLVWLTAWFASPARAARANASTPHYDWAKIAASIIAREGLMSAGGTTATTAPVGATAAVVLGQDYGRCSYGGGPSPTGLRPLWTYRPEDTLFLSDPAVVGKRVFVAGCQSDLGGYTGLLACLDADTGKVAWQITELAGQPLKPFFSSPAITADGRSLLIGQGLHQDHDCALLCFDAATGELRWSVKSTLHIESSPAILGDIAIVGAGAIEGADGKPTGDAGHVIAARISDGKELWRQPVADPESTPAIDADGTAFIGSGFNGSEIFALHAAGDDKARVAWHTRVAQPVTCPITLSDDLVIAGAGNSDVVHSDPNPQGLVVALDRKTGKPRWQTSFADAMLGAVSCRDNVVICPVRTGEVVALSQADGHVLWHAHISGNAPIVAGCAFTGDRVYAVSTDGYLAVLNARDGAVIEKIFLNDQAKPGSGLSVCCPRVVGGRVYVGSETGGFVCLAGTGASR